MLNKLIKTLKVLWSLIGIVAAVAIIYMGIIPGMVYMYKVNQVAAKLNDRTPEALAKNFNIFTLTGQAKKTIGKKIFGIFNAGEDSIGSCVKISDHLYLTNGHVVAGNDSNEVLRYDALTGKLSRAYVINSDEIVDLAIISDTADKTIVKQELAQVIANKDTIFSFADGNVISTGFPGALGLAVSKGVVRQEILQTDGGGHYGEYSGAVWHGMSGGALLTKDGQIAALNSRGTVSTLMDPTGHYGMIKDIIQHFHNFPSMIIPANEIVKYLKSVNDPKVEMPKYMVFLQPRGSK